VLHLNGYKIANPTILARIPHEELEALLTGYGHRPYFVEGSDPSTMHEKMAATLDGASWRFAPSSKHARSTGDTTRPALAHDRSSFPERMDRTKRGGRAQSGRLLRAPHQIPVLDPARISRI